MLEHVRDTLDAHSLTDFAAVIATAEDRVAAKPTEESVVERLNLLEAVSATANRSIVGPAPAPMIEDRVPKDAEIVNNRFQGLIDDA